MTANSIKKQDVDRQALVDKENKRHNLEQERLKGQELAIDKMKANDQLALGFAKTYNDAVGNFSKLVNDFSFYTKYSDLVLNQLKQSVDDYAGETKKFDLAETGITLNDGGMDLANYGYTMRKPAITEYKFAPTLGNTDIQSSATAIAVKDFNTKVRGANSGSTNYDAVDLFQYPLAMDSILYLLSWIERGLALINFMNPREPFTLTYGLLKVHCDNNPRIMKAFLDERNAIVDIYNHTVVEINALNIPIQVDFIKRHCFLTHTLFFDHEHVGREYMVVNPYVYFEYKETAGALEAHDFFAQFSSPSVDITEKLRDILDTQVSALINSQSIQTMSGDIYKAWGNGFKLEQISLEASSKLVPMLNNDTKYLQSFKNAVLAMPDSVSELSIKQVNDANNNPLLYQGTHNGTVWTPIVVKPTTLLMYDESDKAISDVPAYLAGNEFLVDYYDTNSVSEEDQCYNLSFYCNLADGHIRDTRSEILVNMSIYRYDLTNGLALESYFESNLVPIDSGDILHDAAKDWWKSNVSRLETLYAYNTYNFLPRLIACIPNPEDTHNDLIMIWNRNQNRNLVSAKLISKIQKNTLISMFCVNTLNKSSSARTKRRRR